MRYGPCLLLLVLTLYANPNANAQESESGVIVVAAAENSDPQTLPTIRVVQEKLWGKHYPMVSVVFPNVPDFQCDSWCYESSVEFLDARPLDGGRVEMRHRDQNHPQALVVTTVTPRAGSVLIEARMELDIENHPNATLPDAPSPLNLCWQLRHAPGFASAPDPYPGFVKRCFIIGHRGPTFLLDTDRGKIPVQPPDHEYNTPPWVQSYAAASRPVPVTPATAWAAYSTDRFLTPVIGAVSRDGLYLCAIANDSAESMSQAWHDCMHNNPKWLPENAPIADRRWRLAIYAIENDPNALMQRVAQDFPKEKQPIAAAEVPVFEGGWQPVATRGGWLAIHPKVEWKKSLPQGPFVRLNDGGILGIDSTNTIISHDEGNTWETRPLFTPEQNLKASSERAMLRTANGTIVLVFMNMAEYTWKWNAERSLPEPETDLDVWAIRSVDDGQTWIDAQKIYDGYCGDVHSIIQTSKGTIVTPVQELMYEDGRHALRPRYSTDEGHTWHRSNFLDIGGRGHHDGLIEATLAELRDGRVWMLCRTNLGEFYSAYSDNEGEDFRILQPSGIPASSSPGTLARLASGRLMLVWNRPIPEGLDATPDDLMRGGDNQWSDERVSNHRAELSVAFSEDDGASWSTPVVIARRPDAPGASLAYCYVFEARPGEIWVTTMQGDVRVTFQESNVLDQ